VRWRPVRSWSRSTDPQLAPKGAAIIARYTAPPPPTIVIGADELGVGHPAHVPTLAGLVAGRPPHQGAAGMRPWQPEDLGVRRPAALRRPGGHPGRPSRNSAGYQQLLAAVEQANPTGEIAVVTDNLSSHSSLSTRTWLAEHPRIRQVFIPVGACWRNLQEAWWRRFRRAALAGQSFACPAEIAPATRVATCRLNAHARPWVWGRPHRHRDTGAAPSPTESKECSTSAAFLKYEAQVLTAVPLAPDWPDVRRR
jgi:DDE superfamily endonuclease